MPIESVNNNQGNYAVTGALAGITTGAVAGGLYGYNSKPWLKDGNLTDEFVKKTEENVIEKYKNIINTLTKDMKKLQETGEFSSLSESSKSFIESEFGEEVLKPLKTASKDEAKKIAEKTLAQSREKSWEDAAKAIIEDFEKGSYKGVKAAADKWNTITVKEDMTVDELKNLINNNKEFLNSQFSHEFDTELIDERNKDSIIKDIKKAKEESATKPAEFLKESKEELVKYFEPDKKVLKAQSKEIEGMTYDGLSETLKQFKKSAALKWAGIGAAVVGLAGLTTGILVKKSAQAEQPKNLNTQA